MADFENVLGIRGARLSDLSQHVANVLALNLAEEDEYQVGRLSLASFDFVPYALTGLSAAMTSPATGFRPTTHVTVPVSDDQGGSAAAEMDVTLFGPGDVLGVDHGQIVRRYPAPGSTTAEETYHAHIEFDRPELPWAFSAHGAAEQMPAWLALVVFERDEVEWEPSQAGLQPIVSVPAALLPPLDTAWAWAHAQTASGSAALSARLSTAFAPVNVSRLLAARILTQDTNYVACLVPTTMAGRNAGLGLAGGGLEAAWSPQDGQVRLPVYDRWEFRTAADGDFARLATRLKGVAAPWAIGRRIMNADRPGAPLDDLGANDAGRRQVIKCALFSPAPQPADSPSDAARWSAARTDALKAAIERPAVVEGAAGTAPGAIPDLPIVGPRLYAKGQRATGTISTSDWFAELNLNITNRVVAGLGTRVVVKDQEPLMQAAWAQVGEIEKANRELALAELARHLAGSIHRRIEKVDPGRLLQMTRPAAARMKMDGANLTLEGQTSRSATPASALSGSFRRAIRVGGPALRRLTAPERDTVTRMVATDRAARDFTREYTELDGIGGLSSVAIASLDAGSVSVALRVSQGTALATLQSATDTLKAGHSLATAVSTPSSWKAPDTAFQPGAAVAERIVARIHDRLPADPSRDVVRSRWLGGLAAGLAVTKVDGTAGLHDVALALDTHVMEVASVVTVAQPAPVVAAPLAARSAGAELLRAGAVRGFATVTETREARALGGPVGLSARASGGMLGSIVRPVVEPAAPVAVPVRGGPVRGGPVVVPVPALTDRERLDVFRTPQGTVLGTWLEQAAKVTVAQLREQMTTLVDSAGVLALAPTPQLDVLSVRRGDLLSRLHPDRTVIDTMRARLNPGLLAYDAFADSMIRPIMAAPRFDRPMYQALDSYDREWLVPGLGTLPEPELVTLLSSNDQFTEAFLVGLSDEMGRELLWREYPTDTRGTYFRRFWDPNTDELAQEIHRFSNGRLGSHVTVGPPGESGRAVIVIRGEIVRRYPDLTVMALRESGRDGDGLPILPEAPSGPSEAVPSLFHAMLPPDIMLAGLDITVDALRKPGWWIVLAEHPQATRFRRSEHDLAAQEVAFATPTPASPPQAQATGATVAAARLESPVRIAFEAGDFLPAVS